MEKARILIRRLMWMLNEESGSMAWGVGEAFGEALYHSEPLKREYLQIYLSYIWPEGNYLEFPPAQRGILWGIGRLSQKYEEELWKLSAPQYLLYHLNSRDPWVLFFSLWSLTFFKKRLDFNSYSALFKKVFNFFKEHLPEGLFFDGKTIKGIDSNELASLLA